MPVDDPGDHVGEIDVRIDAVEFACFDQRSDDCPMPTATIRAREQSILPVQSDGADRALYYIGINFDASVVKEAREAIPTRECVADRLSELCLLTDQRELGPQPGLKVAENRAAFGLAN